MDGRTDGISPHSTGLRPLPGPLPKNDDDGKDEDNGVDVDDDHFSDTLALILLRISQFARRVIDEAVARSRLMRPPNPGL